MSIKMFKPWSTAKKPRCIAEVSGQIGMQGLFVVENNQFLNEKKHIVAAGYNASQRDR